MTTVDVRALKDQAARALEKGRYAAAGELYIRIALLEGEPEWRYRAGEALRKAGELERAVEQLESAADGYADAGGLIKAIAVCKVILQIAPSRTRTQQHLATLYATQRRGTATPSGKFGLVPDFTIGRTPSGNFKQVPAPAVSAAKPTGASSAAVGFDGGVSPPPGSLLPSARGLSTPLRPTLGARKSDHFTAVNRPTAGRSGSARAAAYEIPLAERSVAVTRSEKRLIGPTAAAPHIPLFSSLSPDRLLYLIERVRVRDAALGEAIVRQGVSAGSLYVVVRGQVEVVLEGTPPQRIATLGEGAFFGELALLTDLPCSATVIALAPTQVLEISRPLIMEIAADAPDVLRMLARVFRDRLCNRWLRTSPLFTCLPEQDAAALVQQFRFLEFDSGVRIVREGKPSPGLFLLLCGEVRVVRAQRVCATLKPGDVFGEMSLVAGGKAIAHIDSATTCWALHLPREDFQEVVAAHPDMLEYLLALVAQRKPQSQLDAGSRVEIL